MGKKRKVVVYRASRSTIERRKRSGSSQRKGVAEKGEKGEEQLRELEEREQ